MRKVAPLAAALRGFDAWISGRKRYHGEGRIKLPLFESDDAGRVKINPVGGWSRARVDAEFAARGGTDKSELTRRLRSTVEEALRVIGGLREQQLAARHVIQGYDVSVLEAIYHVVEHFSMHTGQIIFITKLLTTADLGFYRHLESSQTAP